MQPMMRKPAAALSPTWTELSVIDYHRNPWKNGRGMSIDLTAQYAPGSREQSWSTVHWRLSTTQIAAPGPFSDLAGFDRILMPVRGRGLSLAIKGGEVLDARMPLQPVRFAGEKAITSKLEGEPVDVVNMVWRRDTYQCDLDQLREGERVEVDASTIVLYAFEGPVSIEIDGVVRWLSDRDCMRRDGRGVSNIAMTSGNVLVALIDPLQR